MNKSFNAEMFYAIAHDSALATINTPVHSRIDFGTI